MSSQRCSLFTVREISLPQHPLRGSWAGEKREARSALVKPVKTEANTSLLHIHCHRFPLLIYWDCIFSLAFLFWPIRLEDYTSHLLPSPIISVPLLLLSHPYLSEPYPCTLYLSRPHVSASSGCAFLSYSSVWGADPCSSDHSGFPYALLDFLNIRMEGSCALWKVSLKSCQLLSATLSLRTVFQGILPTNSLSGWNSTLPKFRVLALLFARPVFLENPNSAGVWSL